MKHFLIIILILGLWGTSAAHAQVDSIAPRKFKAGAYVFPAALVAYGVLVHTVEPLHKFDKYIDRQMADLDLHTAVDDYLQYAPAVAVYALDVCGVKAEHGFRDRTLVLASSYLMTGIAVTAVKYATHVSRPTGTANNSFPSGHTATAFTGAHILFHEYKAASPWVAAGGYIAATATGMMRVTNRRHWLGDVVAGAGVGILSVEIAYRLLPVFRKAIGIPGNLAVMPAVGIDNYGVGIACVF
ncbi:MAG: phosphatase PAP2 family protein [Tannerellaceae bacterium]|jgi:membrane-associated phospholipid phosphatase|nr:phosphatase PAP2 family protein [Tannerellaceae bacterium]